MFWQILWFYEMTESHQMKINFTKKEVNKAYNNTKWLKVKVHNEYVTLPAVSPQYTGPNPLIHVYTSTCGQIGLCGGLFWTDSKMWHDILREGLLPRDKERNPFV